MSRKARITSAQRKEWATVRVWTAKRGYSAYKPPDDGYLRDALVVLEHQGGADGRNPMRPLAGVWRWAPAYRPRIGRAARSGESDDGSCGHLWLTWGNEHFAPSGSAGRLPFEEDGFERAEIPQVSCSPASRNGTSTTVFVE